MGCPGALRRTPFSSAARKSLPGATTKVSLSGFVSCAGTGMAARPKTKQERKIHTTLRFMVFLISCQISGAFPASDRPCIRGTEPEVTWTRRGVRRGYVEVKELNGANQSNVAEHFSHCAGNRYSGSLAP